MEMLTDRELLEWAKRTIQRALDADGRYVDKATDVNNHLNTVRMVLEELARRGWA